MLLSMMVMKMKMTLLLSGVQQSVLCTTSQLWDPSTLSHEDTKPVLVSAPPKDDGSLLPPPVVLMMTILSTLLLMPPVLPRSPAKQRPVLATPTSW